MAMAMATLARLLVMLAACGDEVMANRQGLPVLAVRQSSGWVRLAARVGHGRANPGNAAGAGERSCGVGEGRTGREGGVNAARMDAGKSRVNSILI